LIRGGGEDWVRTGWGGVALDEDGAVSDAGGVDVEAASGVKRRPRVLAHVWLASAGTEGLVSCVGGLASFSF